MGNALAINGENAKLFCPVKDKILTFFSVKKGLKKPDSGTISDWLSSLPVMGCLEI
jgi:hypothetical protein